MPPEAEVAVHAGFHEGTAGALFSVRFQPLREPVRGGVLFVHAFAEEMNKSRHVVAHAARRLAAGGLAVQLLDLHGCGDSADTLAEASLDGWLEDIAASAERLAGATAGPVHLWGMRLGALLAAAVAERFADRLPPGALVLWQPVGRGRRALTEFLRLRTAAGLFGRDEPRETVDSLREALARGEALEVAGYPLTAPLAAGIDALSLADLYPGGRPVSWFEVTREAGRGLSPASRGVAEAWCARGAQVESRTVEGPPFWSAGELEDCPGLAEATAGALCPGLS